MGLSDGDHQAEASYRLKLDWTQWHWQDEQTFVEMYSRLKLLQTQVLSKWPWAPNTGPTQASSLGLMPPESSTRASPDETDCVDEEVPPIQIATSDAPIKIKALLETVTKKRRLTRAAQKVADTMVELETLGGVCSSPLRQDWNYHFPDLPSGEEINRQWTVRQAGMAAEDGKAVRCLVLQFHDTANVPWPGLRHWNECYASQHGYDYKLHNGVFEDGQSMSPYWGKVKAVLESMKRYDYILMLDTDAVVHDMARPMQALFDPHRGFVFSGDSEFFCFNSPFCAGVFLVRTCDKMKAMFRRWLSLYPASKWSKNESGMWVCKKGSQWAGPDYEQGAFSDFFLRPVGRTEMEYDRNRREFGHLLQPVDARVLQGGYDMGPTAESYTVHFAGEGKSDIGAYVELRRKRAVGASASVGLRHRPW